MEYYFCLWNQGVLVSSNICLRHGIWCNSAGHYLGMLVHKLVSEEYQRKDAFHSYHGTCILLSFSHKKHIFYFCLLAQVSLSPKHTSPPYILLLFWGFLRNQVQDVLMYLPFSMIVWNRLLDFCTSADSLHYQLLLEQTKKAKWANSPLGTLDQVGSLDTSLLGHPPSFSKGFCGQR